MFATNDRILFTYSGTLSLDLLSHVQRVINLLDITNLFVLIVTTDIDIEHKINHVTTSISTDQTKFNFSIVSLDQPITDRPITKFSLPDTMCLAPWGRVEIQSDSSVTPCCVYDGGIRDEDNVLMKITDHTIEQVYFSKELINLRQDFLSGNRPSKCNDCWVHESAKIKSSREHYLWDLKNQQYNIDFYNDTTKNIKVIHSVLGNVCNLKCRICNAGSSSKIAAEELAQLPKAERKSNVLYTQLKQKSWVKDKNIKFWQEYVDLSSDLIEISFAGGEPMLIDQQFDLVRKIAENKTAAAINLRYTTNGTIFPNEEILDVWKLYKKVDISLSIDDIGERFEYQRSGLIWKEVKKNIQKYQQLKDQFDIELKINSTISIFNIWDLPELCYEIENIGVDFVRLSVLQSPSVLSIRHLPAAVKIEIIKKLSNACFPKIVQSQIEGIINFINLDSTDYITNNIVNHIQRLDVIRNQNFSQIFPEMAKFLNYQK